MPHPPGCSRQEVPTNLVARLCIITGAVVFSTALLLSQNGPAARPEQPPKPPQTALLYTAAREYDANAWLSGGERFPGGATIFVADSRGRTPLVPGFAATADAAVAFDAKDIVFSGKRRADDHWQIWTVPAGGGDARQI